jgi:hypothetical protein
MPAALSLGLGGRVRGRRGQTQRIQYELPGVPALRHMPRRSAIQIRASLAAQGENQKRLVCLPISSPDFRLQLVFSVYNMDTKVSGRESLNGAAEPGRDLPEIDVFDGTKSVRAKNRCNAGRLETADRMFINFPQLFGPLRF